MTWPAGLHRRSLVAALGSGHATNLGDDRMDEETSDSFNDRPPAPDMELALTRNHKMFLKFLVQRLGDRSEAEDVLQEFYLKALNKSRAIRKSESLVSWLYKVLRSTLTDHRRKRWRRTKHEGAFAHQSEQSVPGVDADLRSFICQCLYVLLPTLRPEYAEAIRRIDLLGEHRGLVAKELGISANNLSVRLHRARQALQRALIASCETCPEHGFRECNCNQRASHTAFAAESS